MILRCLVFGLAMSAILQSRADEQIAVCHGYGCAAEDMVVFDDLRLRSIEELLHATADAAAERAALAQVIGELYRVAGEQSDVHNDRGGNQADDGAPGRMDCIDHSTSTTRFLRMLEQRGSLRWHRVLAPTTRNWMGIFVAHYSASIEEVAEGGARYVVDSWFVDNGQPAVILPLEEWKKGAGPDV